MPGKKQAESDTLQSEPAKQVYAVKLDDETIISVEATSSEEAVELAKAAAKEQ